MEWLAALAKATADGGAIVVLSIMMVLGAVSVLPAFLRSLREQREGFEAALKTQSERCERICYQMAADYKESVRAMEALMREVELQRRVMEQYLRDPNMRTRSSDGGNNERYG